MLAADTEAEPERVGLFDLFGRQVTPDSQNLEGEMPEGELKVVIDHKAPRLFSRKKRTRTRTRTASTRTVKPRIPLNAKRITWGRKDQLFVNVPTTGQATHVLKSEGRVMLKRYE